MILIKFTIGVMAILSILGALIITEHCSYNQPFSTTFKRSVATLAVAIVFVSFVWALAYTANKSAEFAKDSICNMVDIEGWCDHE
jgi:Na+/H+-dicarboxylate symporter